MSSSRRTTSARSRKAAALSSYKAARRGNGRSALDNLDDDDANDDDDQIYDVMDEQEYQKLVETRRQREDFVVDDDGLGYYDDGEEHLGDDNDNESSSTRNHKRSSRATLTDKALKKARKNAALKPALEAAAVKNQTMWDFVNRGNSITTTASVATTKPTRAPAAAIKPSHRVDDLLAQLDQPLVTQRRSKKPRRRPSRPTTSRRVSRYQPQEEKRPRPPQDDNDDDHDHVPHMDDDNDAGGMEPADDSSPPKLDDDDDNKSPTKATVTFADVKSNGKDNSKVDNADNEITPKPRRRLARPKLGQLSAPAQEAAKKQQQQAAAAHPTITTGSIKTKKAQVVDTSATFQPEQMAAPTMAINNINNRQVSLETLLNKDDDGNSYLDLFWIDLAERNGDILLFGKVALPNNKKTSYISACIVVTGNLRNLFVLPRATTADDGDTTTANMTDVHTEIHQLLHDSHILPKQAGSSWAGKVVQRQYAFDDPAIPREKTDYLKVIYSSRYPTPDAETCHAGGQHFSRILNAGASVCENFIVKRKLMGPCWVRIQQPKPNTRAPLSWCQLEATVDSPKQVVVCTDNKAPPPVVTMTLQLKTVVNPQTQKSEVSVLSAVCHKQVNLETATDLTSKHHHHTTQQLTLIRPLPGGYPPLTPPPGVTREPNERALLHRFLAQLGQWDPDVICGHNIWGFDMQVLLQRCQDLKVHTVWSKLGRRKRTAFMSLSSSSADWVTGQVVAGRLLADTYLSAQELLRETTYSLTHLAATQLKTVRREILPADVPAWYQSSSSVAQLAASTLQDAQLVQRLLFKLQILPLTKQLTCIAGNLWSHTMKGNRAERTEYLLLHEFHRLKYLPPEKKKNNKKAGGGTREKAKYSGGLVLEPKKGLYDSFILLLDFNSLYPSIIQEYNLCFTTIENWATASGEEGQVPPLPDEKVDTGVLPRVIKSLVERRRTVKKILKNESNAEKREEVRSAIVEGALNGRYFFCLTHTHHTSCRSCCSSTFVKKPSS